MTDRLEVRQSTAQMEIGFGGKVGAQGVQGPQGIQGVQGAQGIQGPAGAAGIPGSTVVATADSPPSWQSIAGAGRTGDGVADQVQIRQGVLDAVAAGHRQVQLAPGTYNVSLQDHSTNPNYRSCVELPRGTQLYGSRGYLTQLRLEPGQPDPKDVLGVLYENFIVVNEDISGLAPRDFDIYVSDIVIDGRADQHGAAGHHDGILFFRCDHSHMERVRVKAIKGTSASGDNEHFHIEAVRCFDVSYTDCEVDGRNPGVLNTATGFAAQGSHNVRYLNCTAHDMKVNRGFSNFQSTDVQYANCESFRNLGAGFASEDSDDVHWVNCIGGGLVNTFFDPPGDITAGEDLGNDVGFQVNRYTNAGAALTNCRAIGNITGVVINGNEAGDAHATAVHLVNCSIRGNTNGLNLLNGAYYMTRLSGVELRDNTQDMAGSTGTGAVAFPGSTRLRRGARPYNHAHTVSRQPIVAASGTAVRNPFPVDFLVHLSGGTLTGAGVEIGHQLDTTTFQYESSGTATDRPVYLPAGCAVRLNYSAAPAWDWEMVL